MEVVLKVAFKPIFTFCDPLIQLFGIIQKPFVHHGDQRKDEEHHSGTHYDKYRCIENAGMKKVVVYLSGQRYSHQPDDESRQNKHTRCPGIGRYPSEPGIFLSPDDPDNWQQRDYQPADCVQVAYEKIIPDEGKIGMD
jgi:hypothetical protein